MLSSAVQPARRSHVDVRSVALPSFLLASQLAAKSNGSSPSRSKPTRFSVRRKIV
ncbi:hypothetical protein PF005_g2461 [Phytophthora fragariae]|uniref:Uncharacterized protein n=1 Tax=Phytophthora fragariae TaxID=53985 RepID=A0A6A3ZDU9_9STRA|nr:hypothetical protein PF009_g7499 [Phytophthora fragariae]KAE9124188.1 hypothetical protein PF007_g6806 [Phytophthora fragariae]KAE9149154.1 hypothetical protein PF006_g6333 [Phytophthora fragariae]KAE9233088.1 hypothetical protein PF005_g2461 [Phytophthora fragariae]KAE9244281.1 hypothetical protein PF004_g5746 [Phytophthora fragariae]